MTWLLDFLPWWTWYAAVGVVLLLTASFWWPLASAAWMLVPERLRKIIVGLVAVLAAVAGAYLAGRNRGTSNERARQKARDAKATKTRLETNDAVARMDDPAVKQRLDRWLRD
jgi:hypothetical protein